MRKLLHAMTTRIFLNFRNVPHSHEKRYVTLEVTRAIHDHMLSQRPDLNNGDSETPSILPQPWVRSSISPYTAQTMEAEREDTSNDRTGIPLSPTYNT